MKTTDKVRRMLAQGLSAPEIAKKLKIKPAYVHTVKWLDKKMKKKKLNKITEGVIDMKQALDVIEKKPKEDPKAREWDEKNSWFGKKPTKLLVQPQYKDAAMKLLAATDLVNHPPHYKSGGIETIDFIEAKDLNYRLGNVVKYVSRAGRMDTDPVQDLEKAAWYLQREITARKNA